MTFYVTCPICGEEIEVFFPEGMTYVTCNCFKCKTKFEAELEQNVNLTKSTD